MASSAARLFESALVRVPDMSAPASAHFDFLIKARKKAADKPVVDAGTSAPAPKSGRSRKPKTASTPAPKPDRPMVTFDRPAGNAPDEFEEAYPHLSHGARYKLLPSSDGKGRAKPISPNHKDYYGTVMSNGKPFDMASAEERTAHNPLSTIARLGYRAKKAAGSVDTSNFASPDHPHHLAYLFDQMSVALHPENSINIASENKKARGQKRDDVLQNIVTGNFSQKGRYSTEKSRPKDLFEHMDRISNPTKWAISGDEASDNSSNHAANLVGAMFRMEHVTRGFNRLLHTARSMGDKFNADVDLGEFNKQVSSRDLMEFSGRRPVPGFNPEHLSSDFDPSDAADFDPKGTPKWSDTPFFRLPKGADHPLGNPKLNNIVDANKHIMALPVSRGNAKGEPAGRRLMVDYLTEGAEPHRAQYARYTALPVNTPAEAKAPKPAKKGKR